MIFQKFVLDISKPILFADDTRIITANYDSSEFKKNINNLTYIGLCIIVIVEE